LQAGIAPASTDFAGFDNTTLNSNIMKLRLLPVLILLLSATPAAFAQTPKQITVGILKFQSHYIMLGKDVSSLVAGTLSADSRFSFVERAQLEKVLGEEALGASGVIRPESAARIGQLTGAKVLVTGRVLLLKKTEVVILANIIGTETGRMFSQTEQGSRSNLVAMTADLSAKIAQIIVDQSTNFMAGAATLRELRISEILGKIKGGRRPSVSIKIDEQVPGGSGSFQTAETELGLLLQKSGFTIVDAKSDVKPDVYITGDAVAATTQKSGNFFSAHATLEIKAQERTTGKILSFDRQQNVAVDIGEQTAARKAIENATDDLAERLLPPLAQ
jgi:hypothetical protein